MRNLSQVVTPWMASAMLAVVAVTTACDQRNGDRASQNPVGPSPVAANTPTLSPEGVSTQRKATDDGGVNNQDDHSAEAQHMKALITEINPHVIYNSDGSWSIDPNAQLTAEAAEFVRQAQTASAKFTNEVSLERELGQTGSSTLATGGVNSLNCYWWGCRIGIESGVVGGISDAFRRAGAAQAINTFLMYFGYSGWAVTAAPLLIPAYAITIWYVDKMGGYRGVYLDVPWTIIPTYIHPQ